MGDPLVLDCGSYETKAGFANPEREPVLVTPTAVRVRSPNSPEAPIHHPVQRRVVRSWEEVEAIWHYILYEEMAWVAGEEGSVLLAEPLFHSRVRPGHAQRGRGAFVSHS